MSHNKWQHFALRILIYKYILLEKQNIPQDAAWKTLQPTNLSVLIKIFFVLKKMQNSVRLIFAIVKKSFFYKNKNSFFLVYLFITQYVFFKRNKIYYKMRLETLYSLQRTVYFICILFMFKKTPNSMRSVFAKTKIDRTEFSFFLNTRRILLK